MDNALPPRALAVQASDGDRAAKIADAIMDVCSGLELAPGGRLPTERALAVRLGVSRTTVRHGLAALEAQGRISRQVGRGTFLRGKTSLSDFVGAVPEDGGSVGPVGLMVVRRLFEPCVARLAAEAATSRDFDEMERCLVGGDGAQTGDEFEAWDFALHHALVVATHNTLLVSMYRAVEVARQDQVWGNLKRRRDSAENRRAYQRDHHAIVEALRAREPDLAARAMTCHLERVASILFNGGPSPSPQALTAPNS